MKLLYGKRAKSIDVSSLEVGASAAPQMMGRVTGVMAFAIGATTAADHAQELCGPYVQEVIVLIDEEHYDAGNDAIANEMQPLIRKFSRFA